MPELVGRKRPALLLLNDDDLTYAKIRLDPRSLATLVDGIDKLDSSLGRAPAGVRQLGHVPRRRTAASEFVDAGALAASASRPT